MISRFTQTQIQPKTLKQNKPQNSDNNAVPSFKGPVEIGTQALNYLNTSPAIGACFVDFFSMVAPRTLVDFSRSKDAGLETGFRESSGTVNHAMAGIVGLGAGYAVSAAFNKANGVKAHLLFANSDTIDTFGRFMADSVGENGTYDAQKYWKKFFTSIEGLNTTAEKNVWKKIDNTLKDSNGKTSLDRVIDIMTEAEQKTYKTPKMTLAKVIEEITGQTGASSTFKIESKNAKGETKVLEGSLENFLHNAYATRKIVIDKLAHVNSTLKDGEAKKLVVEDLGEFFKGIKNKKVATVAAGLAVPVGIGMSVQPLNRYLTKKRTGSDGFVGVEGREPDKSNGFKVLKLILGLGMGSLMVSTILKRPADLYTNIKKAGPEILSKLQYKGAVPTMDQFKFIYGMTIMSRIFAARDKNETRESVIKDSLGFANWLILGGFVSKLAAKAFNKGTVNYSEKIHGKGTWNYITKAVEKTHEEILYPALKKLGIQVTENGKKLPFRTLMKSVKKTAKGNGAKAEIAKEALSKLKYKNYAQLLGYLYSGVVLGVGIPRLNIAITNYVEGKKSTPKTEQNPSGKMKVVQADTQNAVPDSKTFSAFGAYLKQ